MYAGVILVLVGEILLFESAILIIYSFIVLLLFHLFVILYEEPKLKDKFGDSYEQYIGSVPRWVPDFNFFIKIIKSKKQ